MRFSQNHLFGSPGQNVSKITFTNSMKLSGFDSCIMNYVLSGVVFWPRVKFVINTPMKLEKILFFGTFFWTTSLQKVSSYDKNDSSPLVLLKYHKTPLIPVTKFFKNWSADLHSELFSPYHLVAMTTEQKHFLSNCNILSCFIIWHKTFFPRGLGCEKRQMELPP